MVSSFFSYQFRDILCVFIFLIFKIDIYIIHVRLLEELHEESDSYFNFSAAGQFTSKIASKVAFCHHFQNCYICKHHQEA